MRPSACVTASAHARCQSKGALRNGSLLKATCAARSLMIDGVLPMKSETTRSRWTQTVRTMSSKQRYATSLSTSFSSTTTSVNAMKYNAAEEKMPMGYELEATTEITTDDSSSSSSSSTSSSFLFMLSFFSFTLFNDHIDSFIDLFSSSSDSQHLQSAALAAGGAYGILEGRSVALLHPLAMFLILSVTLWSGYLGWQWRRIRTIGDEISTKQSAMKQMKQKTKAPVMQVAAAAAGAAAVPAPTPDSTENVSVSAEETQLMKEIDELKETRKKLSKEGYR